MLSNNLVTFFEFRYFCALWQTFILIKIFCLNASPKFRSVRWVFCHSVLMGNCLNLKVTRVSPIHYRGWLGQHRPCCNTNTQPSFLNTRPSFLNTRPSFWFSLKPSKARPSVWKARPGVLKQVLDWMFC